MGKNLPNPSKNNAKQLTSEKKHATRHRKKYQKMRDVLYGLRVLMKNYGGKKLHASSPSSGLSSFLGSVRVGFGSGSVGFGFGSGSVRVRFGFGWARSGFGSVRVWFGSGSVRARPGLGSVRVRLRWGSVRARPGLGSVRFDFCLIMFHIFDELIHLMRSYMIT